MRRSVWCAALVLCLTAETCFVYSVYPLASASESVRDTLIPGIWSNGLNQPGGQFRVTADTGSVYSLEDQQDTTNHRLLRFTRIGGQLFVDEKANLTCQQRRLYCIDLHTIGRVEQIRPAFIVRPLSGAFMDRFVAAHPSELRYALFTDLQPDGYILFDSTAVLRAFLLAHASDSGAFSENSIKLTYVGPAAPSH